MKAPTAAVLAAKMLPPRALASELPTDLTSVEAVRGRELGGRGVAVDDVRHGGISDPGARADDRDPVAGDKDVHRRFRLGPAAGLCEEGAGTPVRPTPAVWWLVAFVTMRRDDG